MMSDVLDFDELLDRLGGDRELLRDIIQLFLEDTPPRLTALRHAVAAGDARAIRAEAHALKGSAGNMSAHRLVEAAATLEDIGTREDLTKAAPAWARLEADALQLLDALQRFTR
jgi:HPt (histidine-containing phosphotransfer) domain-containing protein